MDLFWGLEVGGWELDSEGARTAGGVADCGGAGGGKTVGGAGGRVGLGAAVGAIGIDWVGLAGVGLLGTVPWKRSLGWGKSRPTTQDGVEKGLRLII